MLSTWNYFTARNKLQELISKCEMLYQGNFLGILANFWICNQSCDRQLKYKGKIVDEEKQAAWNDIWNAWRILCLENVSSGSAHRRQACLYLDWWGKVCQLIPIWLKAFFPRNFWLTVKFMSEWLVLLMWCIRAMQ